MTTLKTVLKTGFTFVVITVLLAFSLEIPIMVDSRTELAQVKLGYPFPFMIQDSTRLSIGEPDSPPFPYPVDFMNYLHSPTRILGAPLLANYLLLYGFFFLCSRAFPSRRRSGRT